MDDVLTDFKTSFEKIDGSTIKEIDKQGDDIFWNHIAKGGLEFWSKMLWMKDGKTLWKFIKDLNVEILSAPPRKLHEGKKIWVKQNLGNIILNLIHARNKKNFAHKKAILIDDMIENILQWKSAGGIGILHTSAVKTIKELKNLGF